MEAFYTSESENDDEDMEDERRKALTKANTTSNAVTHDAPSSSPEKAAPSPSTATTGLTPTTTASPPSATEKGKYVPPHMRALIASSTEADNGTKKVEKTQEQVKLERRLQGLLNKFVLHLPGLSSTVCGPYIWEMMLIGFVGLVTA